MEAVQYIKELKKYSTEYSENDERELISISKYPKEDYSIGFVTNLVNNKYEVYMFITSDTEDEIASGILCQNFKYLDQAKDYCNELINKYSNMELSKIINNI